MRAKKKYRTNQLVKLYYKNISGGQKTPYLQYRDEAGQIIRDYCKKDGITLHLYAEISEDARKHNADVLKLCQKMRADKELQILERGAGIKTERSVNFLLSDMVGKLQGLTPSTVATYKAAVATLEGKRLKDITPAFIRQWLAELAETKAAGTINVYYVKLHALITQAVKKGWLNRDPFVMLEKADKAPIRGQQEQKVFLDRDELQKLLAVEWRSNDVKRAFRFACFTGLRISDIETLTAADITDDGRTIDFISQKTKTRLFLPLSEAAQAIIAERDENGKEGLLFPLPSRSRVKDVIDRATSDAGLAKHVTFHTSRHTFATLLLESGGELYTLQKLLGHKQITTTQIYGEVTDPKKREAVELLKDIF